MSDPHDSMADSPSTSPSSYTSSRHEDTDHDIPTTTTTPRGSGAGLHSTPDKTTPITKPHFFSLPRELREKIYAYALSTPHIIPWPSATLRTRLSPQLLQTCRTIYHEATPLLYSLNGFQFHHPSDANMFLFNYNPEIIRANVKRIHLLIKDREVRNLWTFWLGSTMPGRSLGGDYPNLTRLDIRLRSSFLHALNGDLVDRYQRWQGDRALRDVCLHLEQRAPPECQISIVAHTRLASADIRTLVENFPDDLGRVRQLDRSVVFRSEWQAIHRSSVALEIEAVPGHDSRVLGP
jgi:hypothetical protein